MTTLSSFFRRGVAALAAAWSVVTVAYADAADPWQRRFQDPASPTAEGVFELHNDIRFRVVAIVVFTTYRRYRVIVAFDARRNPIPGTTVHGTTLEIVWTVIPTLILISIAVPSFALLYSTDEVVEPALTVKVVGHQWYWSYEYSDFLNEDGEAIGFDSYRIPDDELEEGQLRLLEVDNRLVLPVNTHIRVLITAADVLHCFAVPSLGLKTDAVPGRLNRASLFIKREGLFFGRCSEICGVNHGFRPIAVEARSLDGYVDWRAERLADA